MEGAVVVKAVISTLRANFDHGWDLLIKVIEACPAAVWDKKAGGYVFWQQLYHCFSAVDFFTLPKDGVPEPAPWKADFNGLKDAPEKTPSKEELKAYAAKMKARADAWLASLNDASLTQSHEGFSSRWGAPMNNAMTLAILSGHLSYHVGSCDAILRDNGEKGVL
jgi:hypothetical protein